MVEDLAEAPGQEKLDALMGDEVAVSKKCQNLVPEDELGLIGVDVRDGMPRLVREEDAASDQGVNANLIPLTESGEVVV